MDEEDKSEVRDLNSVLSEINLASHDLYLFLGWIAEHEDYNVEEFQQALGMVYSYAINSNPSMEDEDGSDSATPSD